MLHRAGRLCELLRFATFAGEIRGGGVRADMVDANYQSMQRFKVANHRCYDTPDQVIIVHLYLAVTYIEASYLQLLEIV